MSAIRFKQLGFGFAVAACSAAVGACGSSGASAPPSGGTGAYVGVGTGGFGAGGVVGAGGGGGGVVGATGGTVGATGGTVGASGGTVGSTGGMVSLGGSTSSTDIKITGSVTACPGATSPPAGTVSACQGIQQCTAANCVPQASIPAGTDTTMLQTCPGGFCTPNDYIATNGKFLAKTCTSLLGAEGRCISKCVPQVNTQLSTLPKDVCADSELCAPCFNPIDSTNTHACTQGCDTGPKNTTPVVFTQCGTGLGVCVPPALVTDPTQLAALNAVDDPTGMPGKGCTQKDAAGAFFLCAPKEKAKNQAYNFPQCKPTSLAALLAPANKAGQTGGCVPAYLVPSGKQSLVNQDTCQTGEKCAPCFDPTSSPANAPTGACPVP